MSYFDVVNEAIDLTVVTDEYTGVSYLEPRYRILLEDNNVHLPGHTVNGDEKDQELYEILKLEVEKRNALMDFGHPVMEWMYTMLAQVVDPAMTEEQNDLIKNVTEYLKLNKELKEKEKTLETKEGDLEKKEQELEAKKKLGATLPTGLNFAKKTK